ncbi:uncharacterized protein LOC121766954 [Salvia splendens]|uniref:uncharacterized protein LOC121766954 n=1 Tax=Salvia splendens TaxID=180675 RepID=UPI001C252F3F|nr:uncharacterized protein LOC121766954 [Salvia splendens]
MKLLEYEDRRAKLQLATSLHEADKAEWRNITQKVDREGEESTPVLILLEQVLKNLRINLLLLDRLVRVNDKSCIDNLRMDRNTFGRLCRLLRDRVGLIDQKFVTVEEQVAMFLCILSHHKKTRIVGHNFMRSSQTVSKYMHIVLRGILTLNEVFLVKPEPVDDACTDPRWSWFKGCLGALEGTYINVRVPIADTPSEGFITPYKGVRYHLKEWGPGTQAPQTPEELFNLKHTKARNVIERAFAVLKMRWGILRSPSLYPIDVQTEVDPIEDFLPSQADDGGTSDNEEPVVHTINVVSPTALWTKKRDDLAAAMWGQRMNG